MTKLYSAALLALAIMSACIQGQPPTESAIDQALTSGSATIIVPVVPPTLDVRRIAMYAMINGNDADLNTTPHDLFVPLPFQVGTTIRGLRVRVQDGGNFVTPATRVQATILRTTDNAETFSPIVTSTMSTGSGAEETIDIIGTSIVAQPATQYWVKVFNASGSLVSNVFRMEADVN